MATLDPVLFLVLIWPVMLLLIDGSWVFSYVLFGFIDPWIYLGYFLRLPLYLKEFPSLYYGTRLSWLLPGYVSYHLFPPVLAACVLHVVLCSAAMISLYLILKATISARAALLAALLMGCDSFFLWSMGWDYVDGAGIAYQLITLLMLTYAARFRRLWLWAGLAGVACGLMLHSQLFLIVFLPGLAIYYCFLNYEFRRHSLISSGAWLAGGLLAITAFLGLISYAMGGAFLFFLPSFYTAHQLVANGTPWSAASHVWLITATWLLFPAVALVTSCAFLFFRRNLGNFQARRLLLLFQGVFLFNLLIMLPWQLWGQPLLRYHYYSSYLIPTLFLALGSQIGFALARLSSRAFRLLFAVVVTILIVPFVLPTRPAMLSSSSQVVANSAVLMIVPTVLGITAGAVLLFWKSACLRTTGVVLLFVAAGILNIGTTPHFWGLPQTLQKDAFRALMSAEDTIQRINPKADDLFWFNEADSYDSSRYFPRAIASTYLWGYRLLGSDFPSIPQGAPPLVPHAKLIVLSNDTNVLEEANRSLQPLGLMAQPVAGRWIREGQIAYKINLLQILELPERLPAVRFDTDLWPQTITFRSGSYSGKTLSLSSPGVHRLFVSDMDSLQGWQANRYGRKGGIALAPSCLRPGDTCAVYSSGNPRDHLASVMATVPTGADSALFLMWVKPGNFEAIPEVDLQDENLRRLASASDLLDRADGWLLLGNCVPIESSRGLRLVVIARSGISMRIDKALVVVFRKDGLQGQSIAAASTGSSEREKDQHNRHLQWPHPL